MKKVIPILLIATGCVSPRVNIIDRPTLMESESSGEWPEFEARLLRVGQKPGPSFFATTEDEKAITEIQSLINGEYSE